jgi:hypothetical protein
VRSNRAGEVSMMNPMAMQLLAPLGIGASGALNIFEILDQASKDIRVLAQELKPCVGIICENYTIELPRDVNEPDKPGVTTALLVSVMQLPQTSAGDLMFVIQDGSASLKMQRMRSTWYR